MGVFIFFDCCDKNLIVLSRQLLIPLNSSKDDNSFVIIFLFLKFEIFVLFLLPTVKKIVYILLERMLIFPSVLCSPRASPSGYKLHLRKNHAFLSLNIIIYYFASSELLINRYHFLFNLLNCLIFLKKAFFTFFILVYGTLLYTRCRI
jgi:hypothetical protein